VGELDYVVLSARDGDSLVTWLASSGFGIPEEAEASVRAFETEQSFFFAARLAADADTSVPLAPVRFVLPGLEAPMYPLRLTALGLAGHQTLDLTVWVVAPAGQAFVPDSHGYDTFDAYPGDADAYDRAMDGFFERRPGMLLVRFAREIDEGRMFGFFCPDTLWDGGLGSCLTFHRAGVGGTPSWCEDVRRIHDRQSFVTRYHARFDALAMNRDLTFREIDGSEGDLRMDSVYVNHTGSCRECSNTDSGVLYEPEGGGCGTAGLAGTLAWGLALAAGLALGGRRKRSRG
jgi:hypothetical protein